jgi:macrodomain Ter protein organizer (MatP/YcbG family)
MYRMATQKRRIIYLSDEDWARLGAKSRAEKRTISALIRDLLEDAPRDRAEAAAWEGTSPDLRPFNSRPFTPVPKR